LFPLVSSMPNDTTYSTEEIVPHYSGSANSEESIG
jgi:hypothetical protein